MNGNRWPASASKKRIGIAPWLFALFLVCTSHPIHVCTYCSVCTYCTAEQRLADFLVSTSYLGSINFWIYFCCRILISFFGIEKIFRASEHTKACTFLVRTSMSWFEPFSVCVSHPQLCLNCVCLNFEFMQAHNLQISSFRTVKVLLYHLFCSIYSIICSVQIQIGAVCAGPAAAASAASTAAAA